MADLSEHFGAFGEFLFGGLLLFLLLLMAPGFRRALRTSIIFAGKSVRDAYLAIDAHSASAHRWTLAFNAIFKCRRDLLLIVFALIAFDYLFSWYSDFAAQRFVFSQPKAYLPTGALSEEYLWFYRYSLLFLQYSGYALFGWLAFRRAQGASYKQAATFRPYLTFVGLLFFLSGADLFTMNLAPWMFAMRGWFEEPETARALIIALGVAVALSIIGALLLNRPLNNKTAATLGSAFIGYFVLTQAIRWIYYPLDRLTNDGPPWLRVIEYHLSNFTHTALWNIVLIAFVFVVGSATAHQAAKRDPSKQIPSS